MLVLGGLARQNGAVVMAVSFHRLERCMIKQWKPVTCNENPAFSCSNYHLNDEEINITIRTAVLLKSNSPRK
jgi:hypothetical protein